jgi:hypothetical protein
VENELTVFYLVKHFCDTRSVNDKHSRQLAVLSDEFLEVICVSFLVSTKVSEKAGHQS